MAHDAAEEHPEIPAIHLVAEEEERGFGEAGADLVGEERAVPGGTEEIIEVVVLGDDQRMVDVEAPEEVIDQWLVGRWVVVGFGLLDQRRPLAVFVPGKQLLPWLLADRLQRLDQ